MTFAITDSASDDVESFTVDVNSITLTKFGGVVVDVVTAPVTVDLATLTDTSQILNVGTVPAGTYLSATIKLDFTNASCMLVGQSTPATILDSSGNPLTGILTLPIQFGASPLLVPFNRHKLLEFDFDLDQSLVTDTAGNSVSVEPAFAMHVDPAAPKTLLAVGDLVSVDQLTSTFVAEVQSFSGTPLCTATFHASMSTTFQIDGVPSLGVPGLAALAAKPPGTWIQTYGTIDPTSPEINVIYVEAGTGTWNGGTDIVEGHIIDRSGAAGTNPMLTVLGHSSNAAHTVFQFNTPFLVNANFLNTKVVVQGLNQIHDTDDLNVGQRVRVFGTLSGTTMDATSATSVVRLQPTFVFGFAGGAPAAGSLTIDLKRVDLRLESAFNWPAGGPTPPDPTMFALTVGGLGTGLNITTGTPVAARGIFPPIDDAGDDFVATSLANLELVPSLMLVRNLPAGFVVDPTATSTQIQLAISGTATTGEVAIIAQSFVGVNPLPTAPAPTIVPAASGPTFYTLRDKLTGSVKLYLVFADFSNDLAIQIGQGATLDQIGAIGVYTAATNTIAASLAGAVIE